MQRILLFISCLIMISNLPSFAQQKNITTEYNFKKEADLFLQQMPEGLQVKQTAAIRKAIEGNTAPLAAIRNSRNQVPEVCNEVITSYISNTLCLYTPRNKKQKTLPLLIYLHGGGWTFGSINSCARFCQQLVAQGEVMVLALNYRLAPKHPFPAGLQDCINAVRMAKEKASEWGADSCRISIGGDSAGGNLALTTTLNFLQKGTSPLHSLLLFYPVISAWNDQSASWKAYQKGFALDGSIMEAFNQAYAKGRECHPLVSPSMASDTLLAQLPKLLLVAAERDILCSQGETFVRRIQQLGVDARREVLPGSVHLFITVKGQESAFQESIRLAHDFLR
ncbi:carboxylesterase [Prevotella sp. S7 MS 2]|nr:carboxylesterase [Prevotella sp. S7 MS 2]